MAHWHRQTLCNYIPQMFCFLQIEGKTLHQLAGSGTTPTTSLRQACTLDVAEERLSECGAMTTETSKIEKQRQKKNKKQKHWGEKRKKTRTEYP